MTVLRLAALTVAVALVTTRALAQIPSPHPPPLPTIPQDPATLTFEASPDHDAVDAGGPRVVKYLIEFSPTDGLGSAKTVDIGKPVPDNGVITLPMASMGLSAGRYLAQVRVVGPTTSAVSGAVGPFQLGKPKPRRSEAPTPLRAAPKAPPKPSSAAPTGSGQKPDPPANHDEDAGPQKKGFWQKLYGLIVG